MNHKSNRKLLIRPEPLMEVSLSSYLRRVSEVNGFLNLKWIKDFVEVPAHSKTVGWNLLNYQRFKRTVSPQLSLLLQIDVEHLREMTVNIYSHWDEVSYNRFALEPFIEFKDSRAFYGKYCLICLYKGIPYQRVTWMLRPLFMCPSHFVLFRKTCYSCHSYLGLEKIMSGYCDCVILLGYYELPITDK